MYHPSSAGSPEYIELTNITDDGLILWDETDQRPWSFSSGITLIFPSDPVIQLAPGESMLVTSDALALYDTYPLPESIQVLEWQSGSLSNQGERLELSRPGDQDPLGAWHDLRVDRIQYEDDGLWPTRADGQGDSLHRMHLTAYGNDAANWTAGAPTPGITIMEKDALSQWMREHALTDLMQDTDLDGTSNLEEFARGSNPRIPDSPPAPLYQMNDVLFEIVFPVSPLLKKDMWSVWHAPEANAIQWLPWEGAVMENNEDGGQVIRISGDHSDQAHFYQLRFHSALP
ncbi:MAG: hypothetical protein VW711_15970, partial [Verrucomicrobiales bacterium]